MEAAARREALRVVWEQPDAELVCLLCGAVVGEVFGSRIVHRADCERPLPWRGGRPRCCRCGGALICDPIALGWGAGPRPSYLADREAARPVALRQNR